MVRTNYDPLDRDPIFDGETDPDLDDDLPVIVPRPAPRLYVDGLARVTAAAVRLEAARRDLSQAQLATELGLSRAAVSDRFRGKTAWTLDQVGLLAQLFGCDAKVLVEEPRRPPAARVW
ncbi:helix-turn-helix domain-containing protein [Antribacter sp. KLBMP9083]|uniref:Helix-turn-helix domain-containing protein n=1 Tax=Antribacter soli TaxID=2910976 RepID=A0AA41U7D7_9MICO|nr:helix-turn-helix transcriptional regulator [Antribacter soli]MCF4121948.1 helix-turn-helix domain-containing protein [Antribacter soli]